MEKNKLQIFFDDANKYISTGALSAQGWRATLVVARFQGCEKRLLLRCLNLKKVTHEILPVVSKKP
jgi:hypothetical protein